MKKLIVVKTQFAGIHQWLDCNLPNVEFLSYPHRHMFYITVKCNVTHNDREKEFFNVKYKIDEFIRKNYPSECFIGTRSCEDIAEEILKGIDGAVFVSVFEDNENGAEVYAD